MLVISHMYSFDSAVLHDADTCCTIVQVEEVEQHISSKKLWSYLHHVDYKFLFIPIVFVFLRIWSVIQGIIFDYVQLRVTEYEKVHPHFTTAVTALLYLSVRSDSL